MKFYVGQKLNSTSNVTRVIGGIVVLSIHKDTLEGSTCGFHYTIQKSNGVTQQTPDEILSSKTARQDLLLLHKISIIFSPQANDPSHLK